MQSGGRVERRDGTDRRPAETGKRGAICSAVSDRSSPSGGFATWEVYDTKARGKSAADKRLKGPAGVSNTAGLQIAVCTVSQELLQRCYRCAGDGIDT